MKIGNPAAGIHEQAALAPASTARSAPEEATRNAAGAAATRSAKVEISTTAASLLSGARGTTADADTSKIANISRAIANGTYQVHAEAIADKLIANAQELLGNVKR